MNITRKVLLTASIIAVAWAGSAFAASKGGALATAPGQAGSTPGQLGTTPGQAGTTPGQTPGALPPGQAGNTLVSMATLRERKSNLSSMSVCSAGLGEPPFSGALSNIFVSRTFG